MHDTWVLVADRARARLFTLAPDTRTLTEIETFVNPDGRASGRELVTDRPARAQESVGSARHAIEPRTSPRDLAAQQFARSLCAALERGRVAQAYDRLVLVAPPEFLGLLHGACGEHVAACVVTELKKNLTRRAAADIRDCLFERLPPGVRAGLRTAPPLPLPTRE